MKVMLFANGQVMVFDQNGHQVPWLQGNYDEVKDRIRTVYNGLWSFGVWQIMEAPGLTFEQIEFIVAQLKACWHDGGGADG